MSLLNYTTKIEVEKTVGEIQKILGKHQAQSIKTDYENGSVVALSFLLNINGKMAGFKLPCDWRPVLQIMKRDNKVPRRLCEQEQAVRVSWRIIKDWVEAQMALVDTMMVNTEDIFLPYMVMKGGNTLAQTIKENPTFLLGSGE
jgi:hypothetical protein